MDRHQRFRDEATFKRQALRELQLQGDILAAEAQDILEDRVLPYFGQRDIRLGYIPEVKFVAEPPHAYKRSEAVVNRNDLREDTDIILDLFTLSTVFRRVFKLRVSDEALLQLAEEYKLDIKIEKDLQPGPYIYLLPEILEGTPIDEVVAHEVWHLIECAHYPTSSVFIEEGTATFAESQYAGREIKWQRKPTINDLLYNNVGYIVQDVLNGTVNPLKKLLDLEVRERIEEEFEMRGRKPLERAMSKAVRNGEHVGNEDAHPSQLRMYDHFRCNPSKEGLLASWSGAPRLVSDLKRQDLRRLVKYYQSVFTN